MESTHDFVEKVHEKQKKAEQNRKGQGDPGKRLPNKRH
ncbi:DUF4023 family protein [Bacillus sp. 165]|nr:DUF4023 family protein [Bacillus sp. 165]MBO9129861.1 DUF4023 family protein [Bacillus sp. 165]